MAQVIILHQNYIVYQRVLLRTALKSLDPINRRMLQTRGKQSI